MSTYELDDQMVIAWLDGHPDGNLSSALRAQLPPSEPSKECVVKDGRDKFWRWDTRQVAWTCIQYKEDTYAMWDTLVADHGPVAIYRPVE